MSIFSILDDICKNIRDAKIVQFLMYVDNIDHNL